jgi:hypothetical protein
LPLRNGKPTIDCSGLLAAILPLSVTGRRQHTNRLSGADDDQKGVGTINTLGGPSSEHVAKPRPAEI